MLMLSHVTLGYANKSVLRLAALELPKGCQCVITGPSGSGKTTLLYSIAGLIPILQGSISIAGKPFSNLSESQRDHFRGRHIGMIFQTLHLVKSLSVLDNLRLASYMAGLENEEGRALTLLKKLGIYDKKDDLPERLSQGQAQRVAIARAVLHRPALLLADEPTSSLDDAACNSVIELIKEAAAETEATLVISTHDSRLKTHFENNITLGSDHEQLVA